MKLTTRCLKICLGTLLAPGPNWAQGRAAPNQAPGAVVPTPLPAGYRLSPGASGAANRVVYDFDQDGTADVFAVVEAAEGENVRLIVWLSRRPGGRAYSWHPSTDELTCCAALTRRGSVVAVESHGMRYFETYKFRYNAQLGDMELIGFDTESFGNAINDGAGTSSYNALTGQYVVARHHYDERSHRLVADPARHRCRPAPRRYTLATFDQALSFLQGLAGPQ